MANSTRYGRYQVWTKKKRKVKREEERENDRGIWWDFYVRSYGGLSRLCSEGLWHLSIFCPFSSKLFSYLRSLYHHTFSKIDLRSTVTVTRSQRERERLLNATFNWRCQTDSVPNLCLGSPSLLFEGDRERNWSFLFFSPSLFLSFSYSNNVFLHLSCVCLPRSGFIFYLPFFGSSLHQ